MSLQNFRTHDLAVQFYKEVRRLELPSYHKDQIRRAASSIALNLAEGAARRSFKERIRFYEIADFLMPGLMPDAEERNQGMKPTTDTFGAVIHDGIDI